MIESLKLLLKALRLGQQFVAIGPHDVAPDGGVAGGNACEISETRPGQRQQLCAIGLAADGVHEGKSQHVGQVADGGKCGVVRFRGQVQHTAAQRGPDIPRLLQLRGGVFWQGRENDLLVLVQVCQGVLYASDLSSGDRVSGHQVANFCAQAQAGSGHHVAFGGAHVHDQGGGQNFRRNGPERGFGGGHGNRDQHQV